MYHIAIQGVKQGPLNEAEVREKLARGEASPTDLCWREGWTDWKPLAAVFPAGRATEPPLLRGDAMPTVPVQGKPRRSGLAVVSFICGLCTVVLFPLFFLFMIPAIVCGHVAQSKIKAAKGALVGGGLALAGLIMGYLGIVMVPVTGLMAAMAIPAFQKVRIVSIEKTMDNDARQLAAAAQQYFLENDLKQVAFSYDRDTGEVGGPLATYVPKIATGYTFVPAELTVDGTFQLERDRPVALARLYDAEGRSTTGSPYKGD